MSPAETKSNDEMTEDTSLDSSSSAVGDVAVFKPATSPFSDLFPRALLESSIIDEPQAPIDVTLFPDAAEDVLSSLPVQCSSEPSQFPSTSGATVTMSIAVQQSSGTSGIFGCNLCEFVTKERGKLMQHRRKHTGEKSFQCVECSAKFTRKYYLKRHLIQKHNNFSLSGRNNQQKFCMFPGCNFVTRSQTSLTVHKKSHLIAKPWFCQACYKYYGLKRSLIQHLAQHHDNDKSLVGLLDSSPEAASPTRKIIRSMGLDSGAKLKRRSIIVEPAVSPASCDEEHDGESSQDGTISLMAAEVTQSVRFKCDRCDYETTTFKTLFAHKQRTHKDSVATCTSCWKKFPSTHHLANHVKQAHPTRLAPPSRRTRSYRCKDCGYGTGLKNLYDSHRSICQSREINRVSRINHRNEPTTLASTPGAAFRCGVCPFVTNIESSLEIHRNQANHHLEPPNLPVIPSPSTIASPPRLRHQSPLRAEPTTGILVYVPSHHQPNMNGGETAGGSYIIRTERQTSVEAVSTNQPQAVRPPPLQHSLSSFETNGGAIPLNHRRHYASQQRTEPQPHILTNGHAHQQLDPMLVANNTSGGGHSNINNSAAGVYVVEDGNHSDTVAHLVRSLHDQQRSYAALLSAFEDQDATLANLRRNVADMFRMLFPNDPVFLNGSIMLPPTERIDQLVARIVRSCLDAYS